MLYLIYYQGFVALAASHDSVTYLRCIGKEEEFRFSAQNTKIKRVIGRIASGQEMRERNLLARSIIPEPAADLGKARLLLA